MFIFHHCTDTHMHHTVVYNPQKRDRQLFALRCKQAGLDLFGDWVAKWAQSD